MGSTRSILHPEWQCWMVCRPSRAEILCCRLVLQCYSQPSQYLWSDHCGVFHVVHQGEGGEQGDPLMPMLYALGQHGALESMLLTSTISTWCVLWSEWVPSRKLLRRSGDMPEFRFTWGRRRCGIVEVTTHLGVARCTGLLNALIRTHVSGEAMDCPSKESLGVPIGHD